MSSLQWGHNVSVVEIRNFHTHKVSVYSRFNGATTFPLWKFCPASRASTLILRFNGATTFPLWKSNKNLRCLQTKSLASMGPQRFRCGNLTTYLMDNEHICASMGPQRFRCGNCSLSSTWNLCKHSLQWGHNVSVVEIS